MKRKWFPCVICIALAVFFLPGCGGGAAPTASAPEAEAEEIEETEAPVIPTDTPEPTATATLPPTATFASAGAPLVLTPAIQPPQTAISLLNAGQLAKLGKWETVAGCDYMYCALAVSPDGRLLAVSSSAEGAAGGIYLYLIQESRGLQLLQGDSASPLVFSADGSLLADGKGWVWDTASGEMLRQIAGIGDDNEVWGLAAGGAGSLVTANTKNGLQVWDLEKGEARTLVEQNFNGIYAMAVSPDGSKVAVTYSKMGGYNPQGDLLVFDIRAGGASAPLGSYSFKAYWGSSLAWSPDGKSLAAGNTNGEVIILDSSTMAELNTLTVDYQFWVTGLAYSPDGKLLVAGELEFLKLFDTESSSELAKVAASGSFEDFFTFTTDSKSIFLISAQMDVFTVEWYGIP